MKREIIETKDGSKTIYLPDINESYHSTHGAIREALHVFIKNGWNQTQQLRCNILEIGFGTGLNAILTLIQAQKDKRTVFYTGLESYPISEEEKNQLNYVEHELIINFSDEYNHLHKVPWEKRVEISHYFFLTKIQKKLNDFIPKTDYFDLIYFDAFAPSVQPEMWTAKVFQKLYDALKVGGIFVTYSAKGDVRRSLQNIGFTVEKLPGPPGKREMLRAVKN
ncbi:MAG: tRNA (5-methylaminomethyl-2-thiouridine)(34)-methyltransferase MnmD [Brumimicrobium sp.]